VILPGEDITIRCALSTISIDKCKNITAMDESLLSYLVCNGEDRSILVLKYGMLSSNEATNEAII